MTKSPFDGQVTGGDWLVFDGVKRYCERRGTVSPATDRVNVDMFHLSLYQQRWADMDGDGELCGDADLAGFWTLVVS